MHALARWGPTPDWRGRVARAMQGVLCVAVVLLAHGALWLGLSSADQPPRPRVAAVQVRQVVVAAAGRDVADMADAAARRPALQPRAAERVRSEPRAKPAQDATLPMPTTAAARDPAESAAPLSAPPLPTYPTRIPPSVMLTYVVRRGAATGEATLHWQVEGERYRLQLRSTLPPGRPVDRQSQGAFDDAGLAPVRLADRRAGRDVRAANFQRERGLITFSGPRWEWPLHSGAQDRLSWLAQLVAIASADVLHDGMALSMWVVGTRGALSAWRFEVRGREQLPSPGGEASAWWLVREPEHPYDVRIEVWLDPSRGHWPLRLRQTQIPGGEPLEWLLRDEPQVSHGT